MNLLSHEKDRAERYNRYFSLLLIVTSDLQPDQIVDNCTHCLRVTDELGLLTVPVDRQWRRLAGTRRSGAVPVPPGMVAVGVLLPETPRDRAEVARARLNVALAERGTCKVGVSTYPDDGTDSQALLERAVNNLW